MQTSVLLVDDHEMLREGLRTMIDAREDMTVVGEAGDGRAAVEAAKRLRPDVTVMDIWLPRLSGIAAAKEIIKEDPDAKVVILSVHEKQGFVEEAFRAGAMAYVVKSACSRELFEAIEAVRGDRSYLSPAVTQMMLGAFTGRRDEMASGLSALTGREREVLQRIAEGSASKEIAEDLQISRRTVESHRSNLMRKLGVHKASSLVRIAIREGLLAP